MSVLVLLVVAVAPAAHAQAHPEVPGEAVDLGAYGEPIRFEPRDGGVLEVGGQRVDGVVELRPRAGGQVVVINDVGIEEYVAGIAEMPSRWPLEALKAQAVAARTYAWYQARLGTYERRGLAYDICDTTACQVYRGREVVEDALGERWQQAVEATAGEVLLHGGAPILARYFSTSGGATRDNEDVFSSEGPRPYLKGRPDPDDAVSPLHTWTARFTREELDAILARGQTLSAAVPVADITRLDRPDGEPDLIRVTGRDGTTAEVTAVEFRRFVSDLAPDLFPDRFPGPRGDGRPLPTTVPSSRFEPEVTDESVILHGRGWGHGVGMGQYGAKGKAERGLDYREILAAYYGGLTPVTPSGLPDRVRVGLRVGEGDVEVRSDSPFRVVVGGRELTGRGLGTWRARPGPDSILRLHAPPGYGAPLVAAPTEASRTQPTEVETISLETVVNKAAELALEVTGPDGQTVLRRDAGVVDPGRHRVQWDLDDGDDEQLDAGSYRVRLVATDEEGATDGEATTVTIRELSQPGEPPRLLGAAPSSAGGALPVGTLLAAAVLGAAVGIAGGRRVVRR